MTRIKNVSPYGDLDVPLLGRVVEAGETVEADDADAATLLDQPENFVLADPPTDGKPAKPGKPDKEQS